MKNLIAQRLQEKQITRYRFWKDTGLARVTAYRLVDDPLYVPGGDVLDKVCKTLRCQPGEILEWIED